MIRRGGEESCQKCCGANDGTGSIDERNRIKTGITADDVIFARKPELSVIEATTLAPQFSQQWSGTVFMIGPLAGMLVAVVWWWWSCPAISPPGLVSDDCWVIVEQ